MARASHADIAHPSVRGGGAGTLQRESISMAQSIRVVGDDAHVPVAAVPVHGAGQALDDAIAWSDGRQRALAAATKRVLDVVLAIALAVPLAPVLLVAMAMVRLTSAGPVLFRQERYGYRCTPFTIYKLRTMCVDAERIELAQPTGPACPLFHKPRCAEVVTPVGRMLRKYSVDEIPQLWNVLRGDMSLVGPRPLGRHEVERWPRTEMRRFDARPGLTGSWQVGGRNLLHDKERMMLDLHYVDNWTLMLDVRILLRTPWAVISGRGAW
jgi:lipopolysaccharide/colanic/teichoic acid biosynthesis glycosyltransferase